MTLNFFNMRFSITRLVTRLVLNDASRWLNSPSRSLENWLPVSFSRYLSHHEFQIKIVERLILFPFQKPRSPGKDFLFQGCSRTSLFPTFVRPGCARDGGSKINRGHVMCITLNLTAGLNSSHMHWCQLEICKSDWIARVDLILASCRKGI